jgi:hypothetical protein
MTWVNAGTKLDYVEKVDTDCSNIIAGSITEPMLDVIDSPADTEVLSWNAGSSAFEWVTHTTGGAASYQVKWDASDSATYLESKVPVVPSFTGNAGKGVILDAAETDFVWTSLASFIGVTTFYVATTGSDTTGAGTSGSPWYSVAKAMDHLADKVFDNNVIITISVAAGSYTGLGKVTVDHPQGEQIEIIGAGYASTNLTFTGDGIEVTTVLGKISGVKLTGPGFGYGLTVSYNATIRFLGATEITNFAGAVSNYGHIHGADYIRLNTCSLAGYIGWEFSTAMFQGSNNLITGNLDGVSLTKLAKFYMENGTVSSNTTGCSVTKRSEGIFNSVTFSGNTSNGNITITTTDVPIFDEIGSWIYKP